MKGKGDFLIMINPDKSDNKKNGALLLRVVLAGAALVLLGSWLVACNGERPAGNPPTTQEQQGTGQPNNPEADNESTITTPEAGVDDGVDTGVDDGSTEKTPQNTDDTGNTDTSEPWYMDPDHLDC
jgi:cytoskeletal protein RodZ